MSETRKAQPEAIADAATRGARETLGRAEDVSKRSAEQAGRIGVSVADSVACTADAALKITERVAEQGRDVMWQGWCAAADMNGRLADIGYGRRHRVLE
jgi:hypothetical protein